jgi:hypothetical protein
MSIDEGTLTRKPTIALVNGSSTMPLQERNIERMMLFKDRMEFNGGGETASVV